ncbi:MAG TPA: outer membrane protein assembly factor BamA [Gammaproteobacteria bacterium]|jgi:outer membrane protein insertion porin family|nr:outer membrane protein assembly factor BamA [Gammaproteobacteria bacterium]
MIKHRLAQLAVLIAGLSAGVSGYAAMEPFVVRNFRVEGAQRIAEGTIYNYLPINIGDTVTEQRLREAGRAIFMTGFFQDFEFRRDGDTLVIVVLERPSIQEFKFSGNKDIKNEDLQKVLNEHGLSQGKIFDQSTLDELTQSLTEEYYGRGKYAAKVEPTVEPLEDNRVRVSIKITEGDRAKIRQVNIVGNSAFEEKDIISGFELKTGNWLSFIRKNDRYSKESLEGDLEKLKSYYMDRGYADFRVDDVQVAISPDKRDIFVTISVIEGDRYTISDIKMAGEMVVPEEELKSLILAQPGETFSQGQLTRSEELMNLRLGQDGYAFAQIRAVPDLNKETKEASVTFFVEPKNRVYVRRVNFNGTDSVNDEVFRREVRQFEGGYLSNNLVDRSKVLLQRLPYIEKVEEKTNPVPGSPDLVDVDFDIKEGLPGQFGGSLGFSETFGVTLGGNFIHSNFMGTGKRVALQVTGGKYQKIFDANFTDPYRNIDGVARTLSLTYQHLTQFTSVSSQFSTTTLNAGINWAYPITNFQTLRFGFAYQDAELLANVGYSSQQAVDWVTHNGRTFTAGDLAVGTRVRSLELVTGWFYDSRNASLFPTSGARTSVSLNSSVPGSDVEYYVAAINLQKFVPIGSSKWRFRINSDLSYGDGYGATTALPPFRNRFGGGPGTVRGYKESYLGPRDSYGNPYGGNMVVANQFELIIPTPAKISGSTRVALFYDVGGVFSTGGVNFYDKLGDPISYDFKYDKLKKSVGLGVEWLAPLGLLRFSYAVPLNADAPTDRLFGDEVERFQFSIGNAF